MDHRNFIEVINNRGQRVAEYKDMVVTYYDLVTDAYRERWGDSFHLPIFQGITTLAEGIANIERLIVAEGGFTPEAEVLDAGSGVGGPTLRLAQLTSGHYIGVNLVPRQVEIARQRATDQGLAHRVRFEVADAMDLPFGNARFDAVTVFESGCHMPDKPRFYRECARVLKPGGRFLGIDWMKTAGLTAAEHNRYIEPICLLHGIPDLIAIDEFRALLDAAGFAPELVEDKTRQTGLLQAPARAPAPDWSAVFARGLPPVQELLSLGGAALAIAAQAGAFALCHWTARRQ